MSNATQTLTLTAFLLARIVEDEATWLFGSWDNEADDLVKYRLMAECEAKRQILRLLDMTRCPCARAERCVVHDSSAGPPEFARERYLDPVTDYTLRALAAVYADHPDCREEWRP